MANIDISKGLFTNASDEGLGVRSPVFYNGIIDLDGVNKRRPGDTEFCDTSSSLQVEALYWWDEQNILIAVSSGVIYSVNELGTATALTGATLLPEKAVDFASNGNTLVMANGTRLVKYSAGDSVVSQVTATNSPEKASSVVFLDGYFLANEVGTGVVSFSNLNDLDTWDVENFFSAESNPDNIEKLLVQDRKLVIIGRNSTEIWINDGTNPFSRVQTIERGTEAGNSVVKVQGDYILLDDKLKITDSQGNILSTPIDNTITGLADRDDATAYLYEYKGRLIYVITFEQAKRTFCYDLQVQQWYEWSEYAATTGDHTHFKGISYAHCRKWNKHVIGHKSNGKIYLLDESVFTTDGSMIFFSKQIHNVTHGTIGLKRPAKLLIKARTGEGVGTTAAATMIVRYRTDDGVWTSGIHLDLLADGSQVFSSIIRRLRPYRVRDWEFIVTDDTNFELVMLEEDVEVGNDS